MKRALCILAAAIVCGGCAERHGFSEQEDAAFIVEDAADDVVEDATDAGADTDDCVLTDFDSCDAGSKCTIGLSGPVCVAAGLLQEGEPCAGQGVDACGAGLLCVAVAPSTTYTCRQICVVGVVACPPSRSCQGVGLDPRLPRLCLP